MSPCRTRVHSAHCEFRAAFFADDADVSSLPPLTADSDTLGRELRDALSDLLLARQQVSQRGGSGDIYLLTILFGSPKACETRCGGKRSRTS